MSTAKIVCSNRWKPKLHSMRETFRASSTYKARPTIPVTSSLEIGRIGCWDFQLLWRIFRVTETAMNFMLLGSSPIWWWWWQIAAAWPGWHGRAETRVRIVRDVRKYRSWWLNPVLRKWICGRLHTWLISWNNGVYLSTMEFEPSGWNPSLVKWRNVFKQRTPVVSTKKFSKSARAIAF